MKNPLFNQYKNLLKNKKTRWLTVILSLIYFLSPIDLLPEIPLFGIGLIDDAVLATFLVGSILEIKKEKQDKKNSRLKNFNNFTTDIEEEEVVDVEPKAKS